MVVLGRGPGQQGVLRLDEEGRQICGCLVGKHSQMKRFITNKVFDDDE